MHLSGLFLYPVKSLRGCAVDSAPVDDLGIVGDRRFLVVDEHGTFLTQRAIPRMALVETALASGRLTLSAAGHHSVSVGCAPDPAAPLRSVTIWKSSGLLAEDCGDAPAAWLGAFLGVTCRLVRIGPRFLRPMLKTTAGPGDRVMFADAFPFLIIGEATLADLNDRLVARHEDPVPMDRFRPNLVIAGTPAFAEDTWPRFKISDVIFRAGGPCARCLVTTTDQTTGQRTGPEPLRTLATYRRDPADATDVNFGQNLIHETKTGTLRLFAPLELLG